MGDDGTRNYIQYYSIPILPTSTEYECTNYASTTAQKKNDTYNEP